MEEYKIMYGERESHVKSYRVVEQGPFDPDFGQVEVFGYFKNNDVFILRRSAFGYSFVISSINYNPELWMIEEPPEWTPLFQSGKRSMLKLITCSIPALWNY